MKKISVILKEGLGLNAARVKCLVLFAFSLIEQETVNLSKLSKHFRNKAQADSTYKRLQRFIREVRFDPGMLAKQLLSLAAIPLNEKLQLILDRTNWKFGETYINILCLSVVTKYGSIPLFLEHTGRQETR